jgi:hypothetical protein
MERGKKEIVEPPKEVTLPSKLRWQKVGGGSLRWRNQIIKPGQVFEASLDELPKAFMDILVCLDKDGLQKVKEGVKKETQAPEFLYHLEKDKTSKIHWNVVNEEGKAINEKPLEKALAEELLTAING